MPSRSQRKFNNLYTHQHLYNLNQPLTNNSPDFFLGGPSYDPALTSNLYKNNYIGNKFTPYFVPNSKHNIVSKSKIELNTNTDISANTNSNSNTGLVTNHNSNQNTNNYHNQDFIRSPVVFNKPVAVPIIHGNPKYYATKYTSGLTSGKMFKKVR